MTQASPYTMEWYLQLYRNASALQAGLDDLWAALTHPNPAAAMQLVNRERIAIDLALWAVHLTGPQRSSGPGDCWGVNGPPRAPPIAPGLRRDLVSPQVMAAMKELHNPDSAALVGVGTLGRVGALAALVRLSRELAAVELEKDATELV